jgi:hypothetical protein
MSPKCKDIMDFVNSTGGMPHEGPTHLSWVIFIHQVSLHQLTLAYG